MKRNAIRLGMRLVLFACIIASCTGVARSELASPGLTQWNHRAWRAQDGAPTEVVALAQTSDGYLWLGTGAGLYRFDGVRFDEFRTADGSALPSLNIASLHASAGNELIVGYRFGGISRIKDGKTIDYGVADGLPPGPVYAFAEAPDGVIWAATLGGLIRFEHDKWERIDQRWGFKSERAFDVFIDASGTLWVDDGTEVMKLGRDQRRFESVGDKVERSVIRESPAGNQWIVDAPHRLHVRTQGRVETIANWSLFASPNAMLFDRDGDLWVAGYFGGIARIHRPDDLPLAPSRVEAYRHAQGLSSDFALSILQDREGSIWVGTKGGIDQFRRPNFIPLTLPKDSMEISLAAAPDGKVWVASGAGPSVLVDGAGFEVQPSVDNATCAIRAPDGTVWLGGPGRIWRSGPNGLVMFTMPHEMRTGGDVQSMAVGADGALWVGVIRAGLFRFKEGEWTRSGGFEGFPQAPPLTAATDGAGRLWFGYADNLIEMLDHGELHTLDRHAGVSVGNVTALTVEGDRVWIGGERGLARWNDGRFVAVRSSDEGSLISVSGIVATSDGDLWVSARKGVYRIGVDELHRAIDDPNHDVQPELFDFTDGLPGVPIQHRPLPSSVLGSDGRLWVVTADGVAWLDPARISRNGMQPPIVIETIRVGDVERRAAAPLVLDAGTQDFSIRYTALSLARPERVLFRYRLVGSSDAWSDPSARREAFFTNLGPGKYRFEVIASNDAGIWNLEGKVLPFEIAPLFWQTKTFRFICLVALLVALYALYVWRLRALSRRLQQRLHERFSERERIARDLHDTLLQSVQGLILQIHALAHQDSDVIPRALIDRALDKAEAIMIEGRDRVADLRDRKPPSSDFIVEARKTIDDVASDWDVPCAFRVEGTPRDVAPLIQDDLIAIVREALFNAFRHAGATRIDVTLVYRRRSLVLRIIDDGCGIAPQTLEQRGIADHFGLPGMYERAQRVRATLTIRSSDSHGTIVEMVVPGRAAYRAPASLWQELNKRLQPRR